MMTANADDRRMQDQQLRRTDGDLLAVIKAPWRYPATTTRLETTSTLHQVRKYRFMVRATRRTITGMSSYMNGPSGSRFAVASIDRFSGMQGLGLSASASLSISPSGRPAFRLAGTCRDWRTSAMRRVPMTDQSAASRRLMRATCLGCRTQPEA